jgi:hypothetical protein
MIFRHWGHSLARIEMAIGLRRLSSFLSYLTDRGYAVVEPQGVV